MIIRRRVFSGLLIALFAIALAGTTTQQAHNGQNILYYPGRDNEWQRRTPEQLGMDAALLEQAVAYAKTQATNSPADFSTQVENFGRVLGPLPKMRGDTNGLIIRHGYIVAEWGDTAQIDPTYS